LVDNVSKSKNAFDFLLTGIAHTINALNDLDFNKKFEKAT
jgi:hypothetical protein